MMDDAGQYSNVLPSITHGEGKLQRLNNVGLVFEYIKLTLNRNEG